VRSLVRDVPDFPRPGVVFRDLTPVFRHPGGFAASVDALTEPFVGSAVDVVVGVEARGFILGAPVAHRLGAGFVPARKAAKLPGPVEAEEYALEYGTERIELATHTLGRGDRVLVVDDVLATGGTLEATIGLVERLGGAVLGAAVLLELGGLGGRARIEARGVELVAVLVI
jgi:adenine phosphoribosyltransferase